VLWVTHGSSRSVGLWPPVYPPFAPVKRRWVAATGRRVCGPNDEIWTYPQQ
jgi:hypothetical protein